jgi:hypothetical protein
MTTAKTDPHAWECSAYPPLVLICPFCGRKVRKDDRDIGATIFGPCPGQQATGRC